jgi:SNF2 family DNA or RNA helicase
MSIPRIRKDFKAKLKETAKAVLFQDFDGQEYWVPKSICTLVKEKKDRCIATLAVFKFEEITGIQVEDMTVPFVSMGGKPLDQHTITPIPIVESTSKPLLPKQREILTNHHLNCKHHALFWDAGTGKTLCSLTLANSFYCANLSDHVAVICPAHILRQWKAYAKEAFPDLPVKVFSTQSASFEDSLPKLIRQINSLPGRIHLIIDESHLIKNQAANRTRNINKFINAEFVTICTATPIGRNAGDLYYQFAMMDKAIIGEENFHGFEKKFLLLGGIDGEKVVALQNTKALSDRISPYISFLTKEDIRPDMPLKRYLRYEFDLSDRQQKAINYINSLCSQIIAMKKNSFLPKEKSYQLSGFLQKIASGFIPSEEEMKSIFANLGTLGEMADNVNRIKDISYISNNNRMLTLKHVLAEHPQPAIIWCKYLEEIHEVADQLPDARKMYGAISLKERWAMCQAFRAGKFKYLIASLQLGSGIDLPEIDLSINYSTTWDLINRKQLEERTHRIISERGTTIIDLVAKKSIDERIHQVLDYKEQVASIFNGKSNCNSPC